MGPTNEYEAKFLNIEPAEMQRRLGQCGARIIKERTKMSRVVYDVPGKSGWLRLRDEGNKVTLAYKEVVDNSRIDGTLEQEIIVTNFAATRLLLKTLGYKEKSYQENFREEWMLNESTISIDTWPGISPFLEIEANNPEQVKTTAKLLGLNEDLAVYGSVDTVYEKAGKSIRGISQLTFESINVV